MRTAPKLSDGARQVLLWGTLWGVVVSAAEGAVLQGYEVRTWHDNLIFWSMVWCLPAWCAVGCLHLALARRAERIGGWPAVVAGWLPVALAWSFLQPGIKQAAEFLRGEVIEGRSVSLETGLYNMWINLFYSGMLVAAFMLALRVERSGKLLQDAAIAHGKTSALRDDLVLAAAQEQVDPGLLLAVMAEVEHGYRSSLLQADLLLGCLVDFLRCAMPGLKDRASTLAAELELVQAYVRLQSARGLQPTWLLDVPPVLPARPFPGRLMLPLLALAGPDSTPFLRVHAQDERTCIDVGGLGCPLPAAFVLQARLSLQSLLGPKHGLALPGIGPVQLTITLQTCPLKGNFDEDRP